MMKRAPISAAKKLARIDAHGWVDITLHKIPPAAVEALCECGWAERQYNWLQPYFPTGEHVPEYVRLTNAGRRIALS
jgi:hypothetical protein